MNTLENENYFPSANMLCMFIRLMRVRRWYYSPGIRVTDVCEPSVGSGN